MEISIFHRPKLAEAFVNRLLFPTILDGTATDGLFITGIRRIGKTTFIREDLIPALEKQKVLVIYADLWGNRESTPTKTILHAVRRALEELTVSEIRLKSFQVNLKALSFTFETGKIGEPDGASLADAFSELMSKIDITVVLIIDEIQETLKSESGRNLLMALKSARDAVNLRPDNPHGTYLLIVGTGSHRSFVSAMSTKPSQPFYGADREDFPLLGEDFVAWQREAFLPGAKQLPSLEALGRGFSMLGSRPKVFYQLLREIQKYTGTEIDQAFLLLCSNQARLEADDFLSPIRQADLITQLLFTEIASAGPGGCSSLFSKDFLKRLSEKARRPKPMGASTVQAKLNRMLKNDWIYPITYGSYGVTDPQAGKVWLAYPEDYMQNRE